MYINPFIPSGLFFFKSLDGSILNRRSGWSYFIEISVFNANTVDPDQTPRSVVFDLG